MTFDGVIRDTGNTEALWLVYCRVSSDGISDGARKVSERERVSDVGG